MPEKQLPTYLPLRPSSCTVAELAGDGLWSILSAGAIITACAKQLRHQAQHKNTIKGRLDQCREDLGCDLSAISVQTLDRLIKFNYF